MTHLAVEVVGQVTHLDMEMVGQVGQREGKVAPLCPPVIHLMQQVLLGSGGLLHPLLHLLALQLYLGKAGYV